MNKKTILPFVVISLLICMMAGCAGHEVVRQSHMEAALYDLRAARQELEKAVPNKGGHREKAIELTDRAIDQVKEGIESGERNIR
jgi:hypothetical protein